MQKIISLSIALFCFTHFLQSCEGDNPYKGRKPEIKSAIYSETIENPDGAIISEGSKVSLNPQSAQILPLVFKIKASDGSSRKLKWWGVQYVDGSVQDFGLPKHPETSRLLFFNGNGLILPPKTHSLLFKDPSTLAQRNLQAPFGFFTFVRGIPLEISKAHVPLIPLQEKRKPFARD